MILIISPFAKPNVGGLETHLDDLCDYLLRNNCQVALLTYQPLTTRIKAARVERKENLTIYRVSWYGHSIFPKLERFPLIQFLYLAPGLFFKTFQFLMRNSKQVDVIHAHGLVAGFISGVLCKIFSKHSVVSLHTIYRLSNRPLIAPMIKLILNLNNKILVLSKAAKLDLESIGITADKIDIYTYWIDQKIFSPQDKNSCRRTLGLPENKFIVLFAGRFVGQKGVKPVVEAIKLCAKDILFLFVGEGPDQVFIRELSKERENVKLIGRVDNQDMPAYYNASDILAWGSIDAGYLGRTCIESISCGLPLIAPNRCVCFGISREITTQDLSPAIGVLVKPKPEDIAKVWKFFKDNTGELKKLSANTQEFARKYYTEDNAKKIIQNYKDESN